MDPASPVKDIPGRKVGAFQKPLPLRLGWVGIIRVAVRGYVADTLGLGGGGACRLKGEKNFSYGGAHSPEWRERLYRLKGDNPLEQSWFEVAEGLFADVVIFSLGVVEIKTIRYFLNYLTTV